MTKPILVGYDPQTRDRAPLEFGVAAARFSGAPLVIASVHNAGGDTDEGREALRDAHALARRAGATLRVLTVAKVRRAMYAETEPRMGATRGKDFDEVEGEHRVRVESAARAAVQELGGDVPAAGDAFLEDPVQKLIAASETLDLLVCGSRGYGPVRAVLLGGASRRVAAKAHCPVIVLPRGVREPLQALIA